MFRKMLYAMVLGVMIFFSSGCAALIGTAISAGAAYGLYMATKK